MLSFTGHCEDALLNVQIQCLCKYFRLPALNNVLFFFCCDANIAGRVDILFIANGEGTKSGDR
jgi:hypothetical protein